MNRLSAAVFMGVTSCLFASHMSTANAAAATVPHALFGTTQVLADASRPKGDYGDVDYADPGYQDDGKPRYPIDTEKHIRAAWSYINKQHNQSMYAAEQVAQIKARIIAAWEKKIDPDGPPSAENN